MIGLGEQTASTRKTPVRSAKLRLVSDIAARLRRPQDRSTPSRPSSGANTDAMESSGTSSVETKTPSDTVRSNQAIHAAVFSFRLVLIGTSKPAASGSGSTKQATGRSIAG